MLSQRQPKMSYAKKRQHGEAENHKWMMIAERGTARVEAGNLDDTRNAARVEECNAELVAGQKNTIAARNHIANIHNCQQQVLLELMEPAHCFKCSSCTVDGKMKNVHSAYI